MRAPLSATLLTIISVLILCALGTWQLKRLAWKTDILTQLDTAYSSAASTPLIMTADYAYGTIAGTARGDKAILFGQRVMNDTVGQSLILPIETTQETVLVNMGWTDQPLTSLRLETINGKRLTITGLSRTPSWNSFTPHNRPEQDAWYKPDITEIAKAKTLRNPAPYILYAEHIKGASLSGFPNNTRWYPKNNHQQYAIFWFTMAVALIAIYWLRFWRNARA